MSTITSSSPNDAKRSAQHDALSPISIEEVYPLEVFKRRTGLAGWALRQARRGGLPILKVGRRCFVRGSDFAEFLGQVSAARTPKDS